MTAPGEVRDAGDDGEVEGDCTPGPENGAEGADGVPGPEGPDGPDGEAGAFNCAMDAVLKRTKRVAADVLSNFIRPPATLGSVSQ